MKRLSTTIQVQIKALETSSLYISWAQSANHNISRGYRTRYITFMCTKRVLYHWPALSFHPTILFVKLIGQFLPVALHTTI